MTAIPLATGIVPVAACRVCVYALLVFGDAIATEPEPLAFPWSFTLLIVVPYLKIAS